MGALLEHGRKDQLWIAIFCLFISRDHFTSSFYMHSDRFFKQNMDTTLKGIHGNGRVIVVWRCNQHCVQFRFSQQLAVIVKSRDPILLSIAVCTLVINVTDSDQLQGFQFRYILRMQAAHRARTNHGNFDFGFFAHSFLRCLVS